MKKVIVILLLAIVAPVGAWLGSEIYHAKARYPDGIEDYLSYIEKMPKPRAAKKIIKEGNEYFIFFGPIAPLALVSGPPAYIFDKKGMMVDWSGDIGEDSRFAKVWKDLPEKEITIEQADSILRTTKSNQS